MHARPPRQARDPSLDHLLTASSLSLSIRFSLLTSAGDLLVTTALVSDGALGFGLGVRFGGRAVTIIF